MDRDRGRGAHDAVGDRQRGGGRFGAAPRRAARHRRPHHRHDERGLPRRPRLARRDPRADARGRRRRRAGRRGRAGRGALPEARAAARALRPDPGPEARVRHPGDLERVQGAPQDRRRRTRPVGGRAGARPRPDDERIAAAVRRARRRRGRHRHPAPCGDPRRPGPRRPRRLRRDPPQPQAHDDDQARGQGREQARRGRPAREVAAPVAPARDEPEPNGAGDRHRGRRDDEPDALRRRAHVRTGEVRSAGRGEGRRSGRGDDPRQGARGPGADRPGRPAHPCTARGVRARAGGAGRPLHAGRPRAVVRHGAQGQGSGGRDARPAAADHPGRGRHRDRPGHPHRGPPPRRLRTPRPENVTPTKNVTPTENVTATEGVPA